MFRWEIHEWQDGRGWQVVGCGWNDDLERARKAAENALRTVTARRAVAEVYEEGRPDGPGPYCHPYSPDFLVYAWRKEAN